MALEVAEPDVLLLKTVDFDDGIDDTHEHDPPRSTHRHDGRFVDETSQRKRSDGVELADVSAGMTPGRGDTTQFGAPRLFPLAQ